MLFDTVCIVGVGLIGGSFGMAVREKNLARQVIGAVRRQETINAAFQKGAVDNASIEMEEAARGADLVFIATPVGQIPAKCHEIVPFVRAGSIVTDAGSTKSTLVEECTPIFGSKAHFVGGHPMAGSERLGVEHAKADLFDNATWVLTPTPETPKDSVEKLQRLIEAIGAKPLVMDAATHDALLAVTSHLPHITASLLVHLFMQTQDDHSVVEQLVAGGWRDGTRVAAGSPEMWRDICLANTESIINNIDRMAAELGKVREMLEEKNPESLQDWFASAANARRKQGYFPR